MICICGPVEVKDSGLQRTDRYVSTQTVENKMPVKRLLYVA